MNQNRLKKWIFHIWDEERGLSTMLALIILGNFMLSNFLISNKLAFNFMVLIWAFVVFSGISTLVESYKNKILLMIIPVLSLTLSLIPEIDNYPIIRIIKLLIDLGVHLILLILVWKKVFEKGEVTTHRIIGSIVAYLLMGNFFSKIYQYAYFNIPDSIQLPSFEPVATVPQATFLYFSYTTLTTTGFGDILPIHPLVRQTVIIEQLIGVLYPVVLIGRLVSLKK